MQNDMRDRLIELLKTPNKSAILRKANPQFVTEETDEESIIADYLIANGVILPPCKVGGMIYTISINRDIEEYVVSGICLYPNGWFVEFYYEDKPYSIHIDDVFLTKDQAEQKLKELSDNDE